MDGSASAQIAGSIPLWADITAVGLGALSGALTAVQRRFDVNGILMLAIVTGMGGGMIRDTLLQQGPPVALTNRWMLPTAVAVGLVTFLFGRLVVALHSRLTPVIGVVDAVFLGVYTTLGAAKALDAQLPGVSCVLLGVLSGVGGGLIRDVLVNDEPQVLRPGALYSVAAIAGCSAYVIAVRLLEVSRYVGVGSIVLVVAVRLLARWRGWETAPTFDLLAESRARLADGRVLPERLRRRLGRDRIVDGGDPPLPTPD